MVVYLTTVLATAIMKMQQRDVETVGPTVCTIPLTEVVELIEVTHGSYCVLIRILWNT
jgi:hypothetical protein